MNLMHIDVFVMTFLLQKLMGGLYVMLQLATLLVTRDKLVYQYLVEIYNMLGYVRLLTVRKI